MTFLWDGTSAYQCGRGWKTALINLAFWPTFIAGIVLALSVLGHITDLVEQVWCRSALVPEVCNFRHDTKYYIGLSIGAVLVVIGVIVVHQVTSTFKRWRQVGPRRTGRIMRLGYGMFWDDAHYPGLITDEKFSRLKRMSLSDEDYGKLVMAEAMAAYSDKKAIADRDAYYGKISQFLTRKRKRGLDSVGYWLVERWDAELAERVSEGLEIFASYVDVLKFWRYPFRLEKALDGSHNLNYIIIRAEASSAPHCIHRDDILQIMGTPAHFTVEVRDATWCFDRRNGLSVNPISGAEVSARADDDEYEALLRKRIEKLRLYIASAFGGATAQ